MIRDITIGQYYAVPSLIHRLDPRLKILASAIFIISLFFIKNILVYIYIVAMLAFIVKKSNVPPFYIFKGLKSIFIIICVTVLVNIFTTKGEHVLFSVRSISVTQEGVIMAAFMAIRLILLIIGSSLLTLTTSPIELTDGIEYLLSPFKKFGVPAHEIAMMMSIAIRFIPTLLEETDKIMKAQQARGADFETGSVLRRAKSLIPILVPLFISAFRRADELATAMEARCYNGDNNRTKMKQMKLNHTDYAGIVCVIVYLLGLMFLNSTLR